MTRQMACPMIAGGKVYVPTTNGPIYSFDIHDGPGAGDSNVIKVDTPLKTVDLEYKSSYGIGPAAIVFNSGCLFLKANNGMIYCFNTDLELRAHSSESAPSHSEVQGPSVRQQRDSNL